ncbi:Panacea domain-containing protein [Zhongshania sp.]|uniref:Panacea domain-containing protein n=1 Tax=Zhongshania sp. TaxID=1971902 RepID=UPI003568976F
MLNTTKTAQTAAQFIMLAGGSIPHLKLIKLLYLADRASLIHSGHSISGDKFVSMPHGPVPSGTLNILNGYCPDTDWDTLISDKADHTVSLKVETPPTDELSQYDASMIQETWDRFGPMNKYELRDWTHDNLPEWKDPNGSSLPINIGDILFQGANSPEEISEISKEHAVFDEVDRIFASL